MDKSEMVVVPLDEDTETTLFVESLPHGYGDDIGGFLSYLVDRWLEDPQRIQMDLVEQDLHLQVHHEGAAPSEILELLPELEPPAADMFFEVRITSEQLAVLKQLADMTGGALTPGQVVAAAMRNLAVDARKERKRHRPHD